MKGSGCPAECPEQQEVKTADLIILNFIRVIVKKEVIEQLSEELSLPYTGVEQDWDIEMADPGRVDDFNEFYAENELSVDKKVAVMSLLLASYEDYLCENDLVVDSKWSKIESMLISEMPIFKDLIDYWSLNDNSTRGDVFHITPLVREIVVGN